MGIRDEIEGHVRIKRPVLPPGTSYSWLNGEMEEVVWGRRRTGMRQRTLARLQAILARKACLSVTVFGW